ncbi:glycosyl hydrolase family 18 protein [Vibrio sp. nBUS_14]|uniref:glycosyl hydrolase family 18 protein n=1 Tax=Vibrio sp. nBUS_14 TaxID=3395321 RepID=UPI003EBB5492
MKNKLLLSTLLLSASAVSHEQCDSLSSIDSQSQCYRDHYSSEYNVTAYWASWSGVTPPDFIYSGNLLSFSTLDSSIPPYSFSNDEFLDEGSWNHGYWDGWNNKYHQDGGLSILSVGGGSDENIAKVMYKGSYQDRIDLYDAIIEKVIQNNLDGVDLDIEYWWAYSNQDKAKFSSNLSEMVIYLRDNFDVRGKPELKISASLVWTAHSWMGEFFGNNQAMEDIDDIFIMTYTDFTVGFYTNAHLIDTYISSYTNAGAPLSKLKFGVSPMINNKQPQNIASVDDIAWFANYVKRKGMKGVFYWALGAKTEYQDSSDSEYLSVLAREFDFIDEIPDSVWGLSITNESPSVGVQIKIDSFVSDYLPPNSDHDYSESSFVSTRDISGRADLSVDVYYWGLSTTCLATDGSVFTFDFIQDTQLQVLNVNTSTGTATCSL